MGAASLVIGWAFCAARTSCSEIVQYIASHKWEANVVSGLECRKML